LFCYAERRSVHQNRKSNGPSETIGSAVAARPLRQPKGPPLGSRNKLNEKFILALHDDFAKHGPAVIEKVREARPEIYLKVIASILAQTHLTE